MHVRILPLKQTELRMSAAHAIGSNLKTVKRARSTKSGRDTCEDDWGAVVTTTCPAGTVAPGKPCESFLLSGPLTKFADASLRSQGEAHDS